MIRSLILVFLLAATAHGAGVKLPNGETLETVDFERHVSPLLQRFGCSAGACHGAFQGRGGFRLSLFADDPLKDFRSVTRDGLARRIDRTNPEKSLLLLKPTGQLTHEGGIRFDKATWPHELLREWIAQGAKHEPGSGEIRSLEVQPAEHRFNAPGERVPLRIFARFSDGSRVDVTPFADVKFRDDTIAEVVDSREIKSRRAGDTTLIVSYRGQLATSSIAVVQANANEFPYPQIESSNAIDREVFRRLRMLNLIPSDLSDDAEFLRRVTLDTIGTVPSPEEVRRFLSDQRIDKRLRKIDSLLTDPMHAALWATRWSDITGNRVDAMEGSPEQRARQSKMWHDWLRQRFADNSPWNRTVRGILTATSREGQEIRDWMRREADSIDAGLTRVISPYAQKQGLDLFWRRTGTDGELIPIEQLAEITASSFMGVRIECAQCHKHPFDRWTQADYRSFANVFGQIKYGRSNEQISAMSRLLEERREAGKGDQPFPRVKELFLSNTALRKFSHPESKEPLSPKILGGPGISWDGDAREKFADWLLQPENPFFARSFVNRVWAHYFGVGIVEPVDGFSLSNPPSNPALLKVLESEFIASGYDIRHLERMILSSRAYQLSSRTNASNLRDERNFSHARPRKMLAEAMLDTLSDSLESQIDYGPDVPRGIRAIEIAPNRIRNPQVMEFFRLFSRPVRATVCDCERSSDITLAQTLYLMTDSSLLKNLRSGRLKRLLASDLSDDKIIDELFLALLGRFPDDDDRFAAREHLREQPSRERAFTDLLWAMVNTREFVLNH